MSLTSEEIIAKLKQQIELEDLKLKLETIHNERQKIASFHATSNNPMTFYADTLLTKFEQEKQLIDLNKSLAAGYSSNQDKKDGKEPGAP